MRTVLRDSAEVFHFWANQVQPQGRAGNVFFDGPYLFSYGRHFCIARILPGGTVAFTNRRYSVTTTRHVSEARQAARHLDVVTCYDPLDTAAANRRTAVEVMTADIKAALAPRIRETTREARRAAGYRAAADFNTYLAALPEHERNAPPIDLDAGAMAAAEREAAALAEAEQARRAALAAERVDDWRQGGPTISLYSLPPMLRLSSDGAEVETSHGARIPVEDARRLWPIIERVRSGTKDYTPGEPVGNYRLTQIKSDGSIVVGCHSIAYAEIASIAAALGLSQ